MDEFSWLLAANVFHEVHTCESRHPLPMHGVYLHAGSRNWDGPPCLDAMEEPFLDWVVVQGAVDVDRSDRGPCNTSLL